MFRFINIFGVPRGPSEAAGEQGRRNDLQPTKPYLPNIYPPLRSYLKPSFVP